MLRAILWLSAALIVNFASVNTVEARQACEKDCGCWNIAAIGHRECGEGETGCHVTECHLFDWAGDGCYQYPECDRHIDYCGLDQGWDCTDISRHYCTPSCGV
jgi:hypothetical protein